MKRTYEVRDRADKRAIREFLKREGQFLLPMLELVEQTEVAIDEVIQVMGRATIEAVLEMSAEGVAGVKQAGRSRAEDDTVWYGRQGGVVYLSDRKVRVERPRLRRRGAGEGGEVEVPAYAAMRRPGAVADRMLEVLMAGVSTRKYGRVIGEMADTVGVSKSAVSRETVEASERVLKELMERRLDAWDLLVIYLDGIQMGSHHVLAAVGVDSDGKKHVLGVREGASENAEVTSALLEDLVERGLDPGRRRLFVIDGSKALRKASEKVFGQRHPIQRCRNHKLRNVLGHLPKDQHPQVKAAFRGVSILGVQGHATERNPITITIASVDGLTTAAELTFVNSHIIFGNSAGLTSFLTLTNNTDTWPNGKDAVVGLYGEFNPSEDETTGRIVLTGLDNDYHGGGTAGSDEQQNHINLLRNEIAWVSGSG